MNAAPAADMTLQQESSRTIIPSEKRDVHIPTWQGTPNQGIPGKAP
jgi:hypothetical protein